MKIPTTNLFAGLPAGIREELIGTYCAITRNYSEHRWEPAELNGGKFSEVVFSIIEGMLNGAIPPLASKPQNFVDACRGLERKPTNPNLIGDRSLRVLIPRSLLALYEVRNNRSVGHIGGDVNPNAMDSALVVNMATWVLAELIRIFHGVSTRDAQRAVDTLSERKIPMIWEIDGFRRVLNPDLSKAEQALLLLYASNDWVGVDSLVSEVEYSNASVFKRTILQQLHKCKDIIYDSTRERAILTPKGAKGVEEKLINW